MKNSNVISKNLIPVNDIALIEAGFSDGGDQFKRFFNEVFYKLPKNSRKALLSDWGIYCNFCKSISAPPTAADIPLMVYVLSAFVEHEAGRVKANTLSRRIASLRTMFNVMNVPNPLVTDKVLKLNIKYTLEKISAPAKQAVPMGAEELDIAIAKLNLNSLTHLRAAVIISLAYDTMARASELQQIKIEHFNRKPKGDATVLIERSKTDKSAVGSYRYATRSTMALIDRWLAWTKATSGYLIRPISSIGNNVWAAYDGSTKPVTYNTILRAFKLVSVNKEFSAHSTRVGSTLDQISANIQSHKIQISGGWKSGNMITYYGRMLDAEESGSAMMAKINNR